MHDALRLYWDAACGSNLKDLGNYPSTARVLSGELNKLGASLRENGIVIERKRTRVEREISIEAQGYCRGQGQTTEASPETARPKSLAELTGGRIPLAIPCEIERHRDGTDVAVFRSLHPGEEARLDPATRFAIARRKDGKWVFALGRPLNPVGS